MGLDIITLLDIINEESESHIEHKETKDRSLKLWNKWLEIEKEIKHDYLLRMESSSFIMIINKNTDEYFNLYEKDFSKEYLKFISSMLEKHSAIKEGLV